MLTIRCRVPGLHPGVQPRALHPPLMWPPQIACPASLAASMMPLINLQHKQATTRQFKPPIKTTHQATSSQSDARCGTSTPKVF